MSRHSVGGYLILSIAFVAWAKRRWNVKAKRRQTKQDTSNSSRDKRDSNFSVPSFANGSISDKESNDSYHQAKERENWTRQNRISLAALIFTFIAVTFTGCAYNDAHQTLIEAQKSIVEAHEQAIQARRQADAVSTPYVFAYPISHEDISETAYYSKPLPWANLGGFDVGVQFSDLGQAPGVVRYAECGMFFGFGLRNIDEDYLRKNHPDIAVKSPITAVMDFRNISVPNRYIPVPALATSKSEELRCDQSVGNYSGFSINGASLPMSILEFINRRRYYLKVRFEVEGQTGVFSQCFQLDLPSSAGKDIAFERKQNDCND